MYGKTFLALEDIPAGKTLNAVIKSIRAEKVSPKGNKNELKIKCLVTFNWKKEDAPEGPAAKKEAVLNKTSARTFAAAFGKNWQDWSGAYVRVSRQVVGSKNAMIIEATGHKYVKPIANHPADQEQQKAEQLDAQRREPGDDDLSM